MDHLLFSLDQNNFCSVVWTRRTAVGNLIINELSASILILRHFHNNFIPLLFSLDVNKDSSAESIINNTIFFFWMEGEAAGGKVEVKKWAAQLIQHLDTLTLHWLPPIHSLCEGVGDREACVRCSQAPEGHFRNIDQVPWVRLKVIPLWAHVSQAMGFDIDRLQKQYASPGWAAPTLVPHGCALNANVRNWRKQKIRSYQKWLLLIPHNRGLN